MEKVNDLTDKELSYEAVDVSRRPLRILRSNPLAKSVGGVFAVVVVFLMMFPFINSLNQLLVKVIEPLLFFKPVQSVLIPYEVKITRVILDIFSIPMTGYSPGAIAISIISKNGSIEPIVIAWNCLGWQSLLVVLASVAVGIRGKFTLMSKLELLAFAVLGTFIFNFVRLSVIFILFYHFGSGTAFLFHNFGSVIMTFTWLILLWWFAFSIVLVPKTES